MYLLCTYFLRENRCTFHFFQDTSDTFIPMQLTVAPKSVREAYRTPIVQQTAF